MTDARVHQLAGVAVIDGAGGNARLHQMAVVVVGKLEITGGVAHRWWRLRNYANQSNQTGIGEIEMATIPGGSDRCTGGTGFASGTYGSGYEVSRAFDDNGSTNWFQNGGNGYAGAFIGYDFGAGNEQDIVEVRCGPGSEDNNAMPRIFFVEWSDDSTDGSDGTWNLSWVCYNTSWTSGQRVTFTKPVVQASNRWWGVFCAQSVQNNREIMVNELEMRTTLGGADVTGSGTASAYPADGGYPASNLFDNNTSTSFFNGQTGKATVIRYDFGSPTAIKQMAITSANGTNANYTRAPEDGFFMYSQDGLTWLPCGEFSGESYGVVETKVFDLDVPSEGGGAAVRRRLVIVN